MNTELIQKAASAGEKHGGKASLGLSAAALLFMYQTFVSHREFELSRQQCSDTWRELQDVQSMLMRHSVTSANDPNNPHNVFVSDL